MASFSGCILLPVSSSRCKLHCYEGYINSKSGVDYHIRLITHGQLGRSSRLECDWKLRNLLRGHEAILKQRLAECCNLEQLLQELRSLVQRLEGSRSLLVENELTYSASSYCSLMADLHQLGWTRVVHLSPDLSSIQLKTQDGSGREHILTIDISSQYPSKAPLVRTDTPLAFKLHWSSQARCSLELLMQQFEEWLDQFLPFWAELEEVDEQCWVLEPETPTRACNYRRIVLGDNLSLHLVVDPLSPSSPPQLTFLGADHIVVPLAAKWETASQHWNPSRSLCSNLSHVLSISFPRPPEGPSQPEWIAECGICYAYRFEGHTPSMVCDNRCCGQSFHNQCLYDWFRSLPAVTKHFNKLSGECPFCGQTLSCTVPATARAQ